jgi:uracil-DNA glycosylase family 4
LHEAKIANQSLSENLNDGLKLNSTYITNILKCVPPDDKPLKEELNNCSNFFNTEISNLKKLKVIITLGKVAFENCLKFYKKKYNLDKKIHFKHGKSYILPDSIILIPSYHPSPRNVNTKLISLKMMTNLFKKAKKLSTI